MLSKNLVVGANILLTVFLTQGCEKVEATDIEQIKNITLLQTDPEMARTYDYCQWAYKQGGKDQKLPDYEAQLDSKTTLLSPREWAATALVEAGTRIAQNSKSQKACDKVFAKGTKNFDRKIEKSLASHWKKAEYKKSNNQAIAQVQEKLARHWVEDQAARRVYLASRTDDKTGADYWTRRLAVTRTTIADENSSKYMKTLLDEYDWIDSHRFGARVSLAAWLMVQHADDHVELQQIALERMETYLENGGVDKGNYAYLWDRVAVNTGREQRYGTQPTWECTPQGNLTLQPLEDPDNVNDRRAAMDLDTVEEGLTKMAKSVCG